MTLFQKLDGWLKKALWHKNDTPESLEQKVYMVRNNLIAAIIICITFIIVISTSSVELLLIISPILIAIILTDCLLFIIKRGVKWFQYFYYCGYIITCTAVILMLGGLPYSVGVWGGAFIVFMHTLPLKNNRLIALNAATYCICLIIIAISGHFIRPTEYLTPLKNSLYFTVSESWMCLFVVKSFYDSIVIKTEEARKRAVHLQELDKLKSKLYANIAHEFRTPLTLIRGNAEEIGELNHGVICEKAENIVQNSNKILFLVNQMLNLSKVEEGRIPLHYGQCDLVAFIRLIVGNFQGFADLKKIRLHFQSHIQHLMMDIETEKLEESVSNLLSNAIKYTPESGEVYVTVRHLNHSLQIEQQVEISVRDTGIGIPADQLDKIFIRFYRVENKNFPYQEGTGIGLTLVSEYLKLMKGSVRVISSPGMGSEFILTLPVTQNASVQDVVNTKCADIQTEIKQHSLPHPRVFETAQPLLLIVEDNPELCEYLTGLLGNQYRIISAGNGNEGIEKAITQIPDIILSDVMMPGKDGYQVCKELKTDIRTCHIPVVLLTARADTESRITGIEHGADAYLTKPFNKKELAICLHNLFVQRETLKLKYSLEMFEKKPVENGDSLNQKFLDRVICYLEKNYKNDWYGILNLCSDMETTRVQLHRKITAITGQSASNFIRNFRLEKAKKLLIETDKNVSDIAFEVGIADACYFTQVFTFEHGMTPTELRKSFN